MKPGHDALVTIITPSYNQGRFIEETIKSVLAQTYPNIEYIVVDGGSTDNTMEIVGRYSDRISTIIHEKDKGQSDAINKGFRLAHGELVGWINSDDILKPDCVEKIAELYVEHPDGVIYYGSEIDVIDESSRKLKTWGTKITDREYLLRQRYDVVQPGSFYRTDLVREVGYLDETVHYCMDLDLFLKLLSRGKIYSYDASTLAAIRAWGETKTSTGRQKFLKDIACILKRHGASNSDRTMIKTRIDTAIFNMKDILLEYLPILTTIKDKLKKQPKNT